MISRFLPVPASAHASMLDAVLIDVHWHMLAVFLTWLVIFITALVRFREGRNPEPRAAGPGLLWPALAIAAVILGDVTLLAARALPAWQARMTPPGPGGGAAARDPRRRRAVRVEHPLPWARRPLRAHRRDADRRRRIRSASIATTRPRPTTSACRTS